MSDAVNRVLEAVDEEHRGESAATRRQLVAGAGATLGGLGLLGLPGVAFGGSDIEAARVSSRQNTPENILTVAATAEVLATIVNTVGPERVALDDQTAENVRAAAREELIHYDVLIDGLGAKAVTKKIWVPDAVFEDQESFLNTIIVGDQVFINAYLIGTTVFGKAGNGKLARITAEFMGVEAVHRAVARQSLGLLGNDRAFIKFNQKDRAKGDANRGQRGFTKIFDAVEQLQAAGFGFGEKGDKPGEFYRLDSVRKRTPDPDDVNTRSPR